MQKHNFQDRLMLEISLPDVGREKFSDCIICNDVSTLLDELQVGYDMQLVAPDNQILDTYTRI